METTAAAEWIYAALTQNSALNSLLGGRIYQDIAPQNSAYPYLVFSLASGLDINGNGAQRGATDLVYLVRVYGDEGDHSTLDEAISRADSILTEASEDDIAATAYSPAYHVHSAFRERIFPLPQEKRSDGIFIFGRGGYYRIMVSAP